MVEMISERTAVGFIGDGTVTADDEDDLYQLGVCCMQNTLGGILIAIIIGLLFQSIVSMLFFALSFIPIRTYAGGYHAQTPQRCFVLSTLMLVSVMVISKFVIFTNIICVVLLIISTVVIAVFSPTETANKRLDETEKRVYKKRTLLILTAEVITAIIFIILGFTSISASIILGFNCVSLLLLAGRIQNNREEVAKC